MRECVVSQTRSFRLLVPSVATALLVLVAAACGASNGQSRASAGGTSARSFDSSESPVDESSSAGDIHELVDTDALVATAESVVGSRMGMHWFAGVGPESRLYLGVADPTDADRERIAAAAGAASDRVFVVDADYTVNQLDGYVSDIVGVIGPVPGAAMGIKLEGEGAEARPVVELVIEELSQDDREKIEGLVPADILRVELGEGFTPL